jgi:hypothetical protein
VAWCCTVVAPYYASKSKRERKGEREMPRREKLQEGTDKDKTYAYFIKKIFLYFFFVLILYFHTMFI